MTGGVAGRPVRILLVEDSPGDARLTEEAVRECGFEAEFHHVWDGGDALAFLRHEGDFPSGPVPDIVLLDLNLTRKHGSEVLRERKDDPRLNGIPVVVLTASYADQDIIRSYALSATHFLNKPVDPATVADVIRRYARPEAERSLEVHDA